MRASLLILLIACSGGSTPTLTPTLDAGVKRGDIISGGGLSRVAHDGTMTGSGTTINPLSVVASSSVSGTTNTLAKFTSSSSVGDSSLSDISTNLTTTHRVGIGWSDPTTAQVWLDVRVNSGQGDPLDLAKYSAGIGGNKINCVRGHGTIAAPLADNLGDYGCQLQSWMYDSTNLTGQPPYGTVAELNFINDNTIAPGVVPQALTVWNNDTLANEREVARFDSSGHWIAPSAVVITGAARTPVLSSCGTSPSIVGSDTSGTITIGSAATGCTLTFYTSWSVTTPSSVPHCRLTSESAIPFTFATTSTTITISEIGVMSSTLLDYECIGT